MNELALFAGAGGGILGGKLLGWRTVCAVEYEPSARDMLMSRQNDGCLAPFPIWDDVRTFDGNPWRGVVDIVTGGFPCQDISAAGKGAGIEGERSGLWGDMARIIHEVGPRFVLVENSPVLTSRGLGVVLGDLAAMGYDARWGVLGAVHAGAPHKRERIWIVAHDPKHGRGTGRARRSDSGSEGKREQSLPAVANSGSGRCGEPRSGQDQFEGRAEAVGTSEVVADSARVQPGRSDQRAERERIRACGESISVADADCLRELQQKGLEQEQRRRAGDCGEKLSDTTDAEQKWRGDGSGRRGGSSLYDDATGEEGTLWWKSEPDVGRVAHGVAARVDRLRALGNGQVPAVVALAWKILNTENEHGDSAT